MPETGSRATMDGPPEATSQAQKGRIRRKLLPALSRYAVFHRAIGIQTIYRETGGGLISGGLAYAALFALVPALVLVVAGLLILLQDPEAQADAIDLVNRAFPAFEGLTAPAVEAGRGVATIGSVVAIAGFAWAASGLYLSLTRAMEGFFPGERVSGVLARIVGILLVLLVIVGVVAAIFVAGVVTVVARALALDAELLLTIIGAVVTLGLATGLTYAIYRVMPAAPPQPGSASLPAVLVGSTIGLMTLLYGIISPWLVSGFHMFGVAASVFVALIWLRVVFLALVYGAAMASYRDHVALATELGEREPDVAATKHILEAETQRARQGAIATARLDDVHGAGESDPSDEGRTG